MTDVVSGGAWRRLPVVGDGCWGEGKGGVGLSVFDEL